MIYFFYAGHGVVFFGIDLLNLVGEDKNIADISHSIHGILEYMTYVVVGLHVVAAFYIIIF